ncbi:hypothetical protein KBD81_00480 [Candidatus Woesebacteria bacterium]|nr:hypothetical protein [Candidatus Woesebacteria bacterium]
MTELGSNSHTNEPVLHEQQHPELDKFWEKFATGYVLNPDTPTQRAHVNTTKQVATRFLRGEYTADEVNGMTLLLNDPAAPTASLLMAADCLGSAIRTDSENPLKSELEQILIRIATSVAQDNYLGDPNMDRRQAHRLIRLASVYRALGLPTPSSDESPNHTANSIYLASAASYLSGLRLDLALPELISISNESEEENERTIGFPNSQMVLSRGRLADWEKFERTCIWGIPIDGEFVRRLPGAIICLETERKVSGLETSGSVRMRSKYNYVRIPSITPVSPIFGDIYNHLSSWNDEAIVDAHALSSLSYFIARRSLRKVQSYLERGDDRRNSALANEYNRRGYPALVQHFISQGLKRSSSPILHAPARISDQETRDESIREFPSILQTAALECHDETGILFDRDPLLRQLKASAELILLRYDTQANSFTLRTPEEIDRLFVRQTLTELSFPDLLTFSRKFINNPQTDLSSLSDDDAVIIEELTSQVHGYISSPSSMSLEEMIHAENTMRKFLEPVLEVRFRTVRDKGKVDPSGSV